MSAVPLRDCYVFIPLETGVEGKFLLQKACTQNIRLNLELNLTWKPSYCGLASTLAESTVKVNKEGKLLIVLAFWHIYEAQQNLE